MFLLPIEKDIDILKKGQEELREEFKELKEDFKAFIRIS